MVLTLFNGKDLTGWYGRNGNLSPKDWAERSAELKAADDQDAKQHWSVSDG